MQQPGGQTWNGRAQILNGGAGHQWPPAGDDPGDIVCCVDTELLYIANLRPTHPVAYAENFWGEGQVSSQSRDVTNQL